MQNPNKFPFVFWSHFEHHPTLRRRFFSSLFIILLFHSIMSQLNHLHFSFLLFILASLSRYCVNATSVTSLTNANYESETKGKTVFIKYFAPWCSHSKALAPIWIDLADEFKDNENILIAEIDCTKKQSKILCRKEDVSGFPTIKYGDPTADKLVEYNGGRTFESLHQFAKYSLKPLCTATNDEKCDDKAKELLDSYLSMSVGDLKAVLLDKEKEVLEAEKEYEAELEKLQQRYEVMTQELDDETSLIKSSGLDLMKITMKYFELKEASIGETDNEL